MEVGELAPQGPDPLGLGPRLVGLSLPSTPGIGLRELEAGEVVARMPGDDALERAEGPLRIAILQMHRAVEDEGAEIVGRRPQEPVDDGPGTGAVTDREEAFGPDEVGGIGRGERLERRQRLAVTAELDETPSQLHEHVVTIRLVGGAPQALPVVLNSLRIALVVVVDQPEESMGAVIGRGEPRRRLEMLDGRRDHAGVVVHRREEPMGVERIGRGDEHRGQFPFGDRVDPQPVGRLAADEVDKSVDIGARLLAVFGGDPRQHIKRWTRKTAGDKEPGLDDRGQSAGSGGAKAADRCPGRGSVLVIDSLPAGLHKLLHCWWCRGAAAGESTAESDDGDEHRKRRKPGGTDGHKALRRSGPAGCRRHGHEGPPNSVPEAEPGRSPDSTMRSSR